ncbi:uncharacterized protein crok isoform X2 [Diabrotica undecimpunctata]|uniref:uncharacterized protein crok isoform X2 n=1 Tax=Diabrotica undecimpunctata TaxID=50387 RepID=UPI003B63C4F9
MELNLKFIFITTVVIVSVLIKSGFSIKCWDCRSDADPKCSDPFDNTTFAITDCATLKELDYLKGVRPTMCRKIRQKVNGVWKYIRSCAYLGEPGIGGDERYCLLRTGNVCKERWTRIRDKHRKALNFSKTKSSQAASKLKPPTFSQEISFLVPYLNDEEERWSSLSPRSVNDNDEIQLGALSNSSHLDNTSNVPSPQSIESAASSRTVGRELSYAASQGPTAAKHK